MTGAKILVQSLRDLGVTHVFGYTGAAILPVIDEIGQSDIEFVVNSNEQSAAFSAGGYSRSGSRMGVAVVTSGPAITNTLTAVSDANADSIPLLVIAGQVPEHKLGTDSFQHINVSQIFEGAAKAVVLVDDISRIESVIKDSWFLAQNGKPGPVVIDIPLNLQKAEGAYQDLPVDLFKSAYQSEAHLSEQQCFRFFELLASSKRPLLYVGGGVNSVAASEIVRKFSKRFNIPSVNTLMGKGAIDETDDTSLGLLGMFGTPYANKIIEENDLFIALGVRWDDRVAEKVGFAIKSRIAYIDINPAKVKQIRIERQPDFSAVGDVSHILGDLLGYACNKEIDLDFSGWGNHAAKIKKRWPLDYNRESDKIQQANVIDTINRLLPPDTVITTGVGNHQLLAAQYIKMSTPRCFLTSGSFGTMGFGMPAAIGAYYANPEKKVLVIDGDGSFRMNMGEVHTIAQYGLPVKIVLLNNRSDGMVRNLENLSFGGRHSATERQIDADFSKMASVFGFDYSRRISKTDEISSALKELFSATGPALLEVITDIDEAIYPLVPVGKGYHEMVLGPYIKEIAD
ncbi:MAG: thiamine pyrophosphate-binding protein [Spirochaetes bacterium]|nr:thiamine pyrophosphate-binding protein [Spirochaetota bacterium]MBN2771960.1 thiamine pyrophosphate-binding protein [Spirochaetota bacterium]